MKHTPLLPKGFIASCQPVRGGLFDQADFVRRYALACEAAGAVALRIESVRDLVATRPVTSLPIVGLVKRIVDGSDVLITPEVVDVANVLQAGADVVAIDATARTRPVSFERLCATAHDAEREVMADVATFDEGLAAWEAGCTYVGTTLSGYAPGSPKMDAPDLNLVARLAEAGVRTIAEGRYSHPTQARQAIEAGAYAVTIGTAISRPELLAQSFSDAIRNAL